MRTESAHRRRVGRTFDTIAEAFDATRRSPWPEVERFVADRVSGSGIGLDIGCGNGRHARLLADRLDTVVGLDLSGALLRIAADQLGPTCTFQPVLGAASALPFETDSIDVGLYIATIHHLRPQSTRTRSLDELDRVLRPGAPALVSAWSTAADRFDATSGFDTTIDWQLESGRAIERYYHIYDPDEFERDLSASCLRVDDQFLSNGNCYAVVRGSS